MSLIYSHTFQNGLVLLGEPMPGVESAALTITVPYGSAFDPADRIGVAHLLCEMVVRGAGTYDKHGFSDALDFLGVDRMEMARKIRTAFSATMVGSRLPEVLPLYASVLREAHLPDDELEPTRHSVLHGVYSLEDDPQWRVFNLLTQRYFPDPLNRTEPGTVESLSAIHLNDVKQAYHQGFRPNGTLIGVAGRFDWDRLREDLARLLGDWQPVEASELKLVDQQPSYFHEQCESHQTHLALAYPSVPMPHPDYLRAAVAVEVLSGGMSSRLFTEIRENRGLCYSVYASYQTYRELGLVQCYAGSRPERAQETLDVLLDELRRLTQGISPGELERVKAQYKSSTIMEQESSMSRSVSLVSDWYHLGRVRSLEEIMAEIDALTVDEMNAYLAAHPPGDWTIVTLGPEPLNVDAALV